MNTLDFSPLFRSMIGFDRLANAMETAYRTDAGGFPPYNIERKDENRYAITLAVAGFKEDELNLEVKENWLTVSGQHKADTQSEEGEFLYRGIANRSFERRFRLADYVKVQEARLENGVLHIDLEREVPEAMKPRRIEIRNAAGSHQAIEQDAESKETAQAA